MEKKISSIPVPEQSSGRCKLTRNSKKGEPTHSIKGKTLHPVKGKISHRAKSRAVSYTVTGVLCFSAVFCLGSASLSAFQASYKTSTAHAEMVSLSGTIPQGQDSAQSLASLPLSQISSSNAVLTGCRAISKLTAPVEVGKNTVRSGSAEQEGEGQVWISDTGETRVVNAEEVTTDKDVEDIEETRAASCKEAEPKEQDLEEDRAVNCKETQRFLVSVHSLTVRAEPKNRSKDIGYFHSGAEFDAVSVGRGWYQVSYSGQTGYVYGEYLQEAE